MLGSWLTEVRGCRPIRLMRPRGEGSVDALSDRGLRGDGASAPCHDEASVRSGLGAGDDGDVGEDGDVGDVGDVGEGEGLDGVSPGFAERRLRGRWRLNEGMCERCMEVKRKPENR